jgi:hypothetical protein
MMLAAGSSAMTLLADDDTDKGSPIGILVLLILVIAVYFLYRSMTRHVKAVPEKFDSVASGDTTSAERPTDQPAASGEPAADPPTTKT